MSDVVPVYQILTFQLGQAQVQPQEMRGKWNYLRFSDCADINGNFSPDGKLKVIVGHRTEDAVIMRINGLVTGETESYQFSWDAQPGLVATFFASWVDPAGNGLKVEAPPAKQLVTTAAGTAIAAAQVMVGLSPVTLVAAATTRQSVTIRNRGSGAIYLGGPAVTKNTGFAIDPGETFTFSGTTAAIWVVGSSANTPVHWLQEA